ncbi:MAG: hypothetical protein ACRD2B_08100 [Terriglobia bacterium]
MLLVAGAPAWAQTNVTASSTGIGNWSATSTWNCGPPINGGCEPNNGTPAGDFLRRDDKFGKRRNYGRHGRYQPDH